MSSAGAIVPDGNYNVEFKLYNALSSSGSSQGSCTGDSACLWVETRTSGNVVRVVNGYLTVNLGSVTTLPSIDWSQNLWLGMNIGGTGTPSWDGEMTPRLQLTAVPYALNAGQLGGLSASGFIQNTVSVQSANVSVQAATSGTVAATFRANAAGTGDVLDLQNGSGAAVATFGSSGAVLVKNSANSPTAFQIQPSASTTDVLDVDTQNSRVGIGNNAPSYTLDVTGDINSSTALRIAGTSVCDTVGGTGCTAKSGSGFYIHNQVTPIQSANINIASGSGTASDPTAQIQLAAGQTGDALDVGLTNTSGTETNGLYINRNGAGTTTNALNITNTAGTLTNGLAFGGTIGTDINRASGALTLQGASGVTLTAGGTAQNINLTPSTTGAVMVGGTSPTITSLTNTGITLQGGTGTSTNNGGNVTLQGGTASGSGVKGLITLNGGTVYTTATFSSAVTATITQILIDSNTTILATATVANQAFTVPSPTITTAGRVIYIVNAGSNAFTLVASSITYSLNGGNTAILVWNGSAWTNSGASTLQAAYGLSTGGTNATPTIKLITGIDYINIQDADSPLGGASGSNFMALRSSNSSGLGSVVFGFGTLGQFFEQAATDNANVVQIESHAGGTYLGIDTSGQYVNIGSTAGSTGGSGAAGTAYSGSTVNIETSPNINSTVNIGSTTLAGGGTATINIGYTSTSGGGSIVNVGSGSGASSGSTIVRSATSLTLTGNAASTWSTAAGALSIQGAGGLNLNTSSNATVQVGNTALSSGTQTIGIGNNTTSGGTTNVTIGPGSTAGGSVILQGQGITNTITGASSNPTDIIKTTNNSTNAFQVQDSNSLSVLNADTQNDRVGIGTGTPAYQLEVVTANTGAISVLSVNDGIGGGQTGGVSVGYNSTPGSPTILDGFEAGSTSNFTTNAPGGTGSIGVATNIKHNGKYSAKIIESGSSVPTSLSYAKVITNGNTYAFREYVYEAARSSTRDLMYVTRSSANTIEVSEVNGAGNLCIYDGSSNICGAVTRPLSLSQWNKIELVGTVGGNVSLYLNNVLVVTASSANITATGSTATFAIGDLNGGGGNGYTKYFDDVEFDTSTTIQNNYGADSLGVTGSANFAGDFWASGPALFSDATTSTTAFVIQSSTGQALFSGDTTNNRIVIGTGTTGQTTPYLLVLDEGSSSADPTEVNGAMYYNANKGSFRCGVGGAWINCVNGIANNVSTPGLTGTISLSGAAGTIYICPIYLDGQMTINQIRTNVTSSPTTPGDIGLYNASGTLVLNGGSSSLTAATGIKTITPTQSAANRILEAGQYYAAITFNSANAGIEGVTQTGAMVQRMGTLSGGGLVLPSSITLSSITAGTLIPGLSFNN